MSQDGRKPKKRLGTHGPQPVCWYSKLREIRTDRRGPFRAETDVVLRRAALIAVAFQHDHCVGKIGENRAKRLGIFLQGGAGIVTYIALVEVKICIGDLRLQPDQQGLGFHLRWREDR
jgi:hypothetical protein